MTEAVGGMILWAQMQLPPIAAIIAETDPDNPASIKVLERNQFQRFAETEENIWWRLSI